MHCECMTRQQSNLGCLELDGGFFVFINYTLRLYYLLFLFMAVRAETRESS